VIPTGVKATATALIGFVVFVVLLFLPAGTFDYWQAWLFITVFAASTWVPAAYLIRTNPAALERRMRAGPLAETRTVQKVVIGVAGVSALGQLVLCAFDHRFGWSAVPAAVSAAGDLLVAVGLGIALLAVVQNSYAAANVTVEAGQKTVSTGLYGFVRHPMYLGNLVMMVGIPLALGSYWGLLILVPGVFVLAVRIVDEEKMLEQELDGYGDYARKVRYRLMPYVW
jgi:protein-S-isoprenylcysteine O-methyltransferase Ste14